jgi:nucleoside phosphorylase
MGNRDDQLVVVLSALEVEYRAVRAHVLDVEAWQHPSGTIFEIGTIAGTDRRIAMALTGKGNVQAGVITAHSAEFAPVAVVFVGIAGALRDTIELGDLIVATRVYGYHGGRQEDDEFSVRPRAWDAAHRLIQLAQHLSRTSWQAELDGGLTTPKAHFEAVAAGDVVLDSRKAALAGFLRRNYNDAVAVSMEDAGVAQAAHLSGIDVIVVRGISDKADGTKNATSRDWQPIAAANAASFAIALIKAHVTTKSDDRGGRSWPNRERELARLEQDAQQLLGDVAGPAERYQAAVDFDRTVSAGGLDASLAVMARLPPLPSGPASAVCAELEELLESAAGRHDEVADRADVAATHRRRDADHRVAGFEAPAPSPHAVAAAPPPLPTYNLQFRNQTLLTLAAAVAAVVIFYVGSSSYSGQNSTGDTVRAVLGLVVFGIAIVQLVRWLKAIPSGLIAVRDNARTRTNHKRRLDEYERSTGQQRQAVSSYQKAEKRRLESLKNARAAHEREERVATELSHIAHQGQRLAASLRDGVVVHQLRDLKNRYAELDQS